MTLRCRYCNKLLTSIIGHECLKGIKGREMWKTKSNRRCKTEIKANPYSNRLRKRLRKKTKVID